MDYVAYENLDQFSIMGRCLYVSGWARGFDPELFYDGISLLLLTTRVKRPDVAGVFNDPSAEDWGFVCSAILPTDRVERSKLAFGFRRGQAKTDPARDCAANEDALFQAMQDRFIRMVEESGGSLLEIGSRARSGNSYRKWFPASTEYLGLDVSSGQNVDVVGDAHDMPVTRRFDHMFSVSVFEHLLMPWKVALEMNRCMNDGGTALIVSHASFPLHDEPWDFWRFSKEAWRGIFNSHTGFEIIEAHYRYPASIVPRYVSDEGFEGLYSAPGFLTSGCLVRKVGVPQVQWNAKVSDVYNMDYTHGV